MARRILPLLFVVMTGCASSEQGPVASLAAQSAVVPATYELSGDELGLDCSKLAGRMHMRLLQVRNSADRPATTEVSRVAQIAANPFLGGTRYAADPTGDDARDRAMLEAYNRRLAEKNCKTFDLDAELRRPRQS